MSERLNERKDNNPAYMWDLRDLFENDEQWETVFSEAEKPAKDLAAFRGTLNTPDSIIRFLKQFWTVSSRVSNLYTYASQRHHEDMRAGKAQSMYARAQRLAASFSEAVSFAEPELLSMSDDAYDSLMKDPVSEEYRYYLSHLRRKRAHILSAKEENILAALKEVTDSPAKIAESLMNADLVFSPVTDSSGNEIPLNQSVFILLQSSEDRILRENAFRSFYKTYKQNSNTLAASLASAVKASSAEAKIRNYASDREMSLDSEHIPVSVYDNLIETVHKRLPAMYRYLKLRKRMLGLDELHYYDLYAPLTADSDKRYSFEEAEVMVRDAVKPLGTKYSETAAAAFRDHWMDVYPNAGKMGGAYSSGTYDSKPYILLNYTGTLQDVSVIAHELGHSLHSWLANHTQPVHYSSYTMFVAEVASTVNENLFAESLLQKTTDLKEKMAVLNLMLEGFKGTVFRQTMFAEFEREIHAASERGEVLTAEMLSAKYEELIRLYFGDELVFDEEVRFEWARIPHFYYLFYVYVYATGYCSAAALSEKILHDGEDAVKKYLEFLSMGGSRDPLDELMHAGVDLNTPEPINRAIDKFERILDEAEKTAAALGLMK